MSIVRRYEDGSYIVTEYLSGAIVRTIKPSDSPTPEEPWTTLKEQIYAENLYQTALLEMQQMLGGM